jgi:hypothetical protein
MAAALDIFGFEPQRLGGKPRSCEYTKFTRLA